VHISNTFINHYLISIELAIQIQKNPLILDLYESEFFQSVEALKKFKEYELNLVRFKSYVLHSKQDIVSQINKIFEELLSKFEEASSDLMNKNGVLANYTKTLSEEGKALLESFKSNGMKGIFKDYIHELQIEIDEIVNDIRRKIHINNTNSQVHQNISKEENLESADEILKFMISEKECIIEEMGKEIAQKDKQLQELDSLTWKMKRDLFDYQQKIAQMDKNFEIVDKERNELSSRNEELYAYLNQAKSQLEESQLAFRNVSPSLIIEISSSEEEIPVEKMKKELRALRSYKNKHRNKLIKLEDTISELKEELHHIHKQLNTQIRQKLESVNFEEGVRYIYIPQYNTKRLLKTDVMTGKVGIINLDSMNREFFDTSTCLLGSGDIICAGFSNPVSSEVYLYRVKTRKCIRLPDLSSPRFLISLFYYKGYVYSFGGINQQHQYVDTAERLSLSSSRFENLPAIMHAKSIVSCVGINEKIYLFSGADKSISYLDLNLLRFQVLEIDNSETESCLGVAYEYSDRIYLVTTNHLQIYDSSLNKLFHFENKHKHKRYSIHNVIASNDSIYLYNYSLQSIEQVSIPTSDIHYSMNNLNHRFIYKTRTNSRDLHRIDIENSTLQVFSFIHSLDRNFNGTSTCVMLNGNIFIAGFTEPVDGACYIFDPKSNTCFRAQDMPTPRDNVTLFYYKQSVYAFGGRNVSGRIMKNAESFELESGNWTKLRNMSRARKLASCVGIDNSIYIFGSGNRTAEIYNLYSDTYSLIHLELYNHMVAINVNDLIFLLGESDYTVLSKDLRIIDRSQLVFREFDYIYSLGNTVAYKGSIFFYNDSKNLLERFNIETKDRGIVIIK
jgi:hypothetical protein